MPTYEKNEEVQKCSVYTNVIYEWPLRWKKKQKWRQIETHLSGACGKSIYLRYRGISILIFLSPQRLGMCVFIVGGWWHIVTNQREVFSEMKKNRLQKKLFFFDRCVYTQKHRTVFLLATKCVCNFSVIYTLSSICHRDLSDIHIAAIVEIQTRGGIFFSNFQPRAFFHRSCPKSNWSDIDFLPSLYLEHHRFSMKVEALK